jgi:hypothetical protein
MPWPEDRLLSRVSAFMARLPALDPTSLSPAVWRGLVEGGTDSGLAGGVVLGDVSTAFEVLHALLKIAGKAA